MRSSKYGITTPCFIFNATASKSGMFILFEGSMHTRKSSVDLSLPSNSIRKFQIAWQRRGAACEYHFRSGNYKSRVLSSPIVRESWVQLNIPWVGSALVGSFWFCASVLLSIKVRLMFTIHIFEGQWWLIWPVLKPIYFGFMCIRRQKWVKSDSFSNIMSAYFCSHPGYTC